LYGEYLTIILVNLIIIGLYGRYDRQTHSVAYITKELTFVTLVAVPLLMQKVPPSVFRLSVFITMLLSNLAAHYLAVFLSKFPQILVNHQNRHTGQLSFWTVVM